MKKSSTKPIAVFEILTGAGLILFWIGFFTVGLSPAQPPVGYLQYEHSFPLPDCILSVTLIVTAIGLLQGKPWARVLSLVCAGGLLFLGVLDFSFNIQNGMYAISPADLVLNAFINLWCVIFGLVLAFTAGREA